MATPTNPHDDPMPISPLVAAAFELHAARGWHFADAVEHIDDMIQNDMSCPASALFSPDQVRTYYRKRGQLINVVCLPPRVRVG